MEVRVGDWVRIVETLGAYRDEWYGLVGQMDGEDWLFVLRLNHPGTARSVSKRYVREVRRGQSD